MAEKNIIVDCKFVSNFIIYRKAIEKLIEEGWNEEEVASIFDIADVPIEYLEVPVEVIHQFMALDMMMGEMQDE